MIEWLPGSTYVVVVMRGPEDISHTTWPTKVEAKRYMQKLRQQGTGADDIRLYHARMIKPALRSL